MGFDILGFVSIWVVFGFFLLSVRWFFLAGLGWPGERGGSGWVDVCIRSRKRKREKEGAIFLSLYPIQESVPILIVYLLFIIGNQFL